MIKTGNRPAVRLFLFIIFFISMSKAYAGYPAIGAFIYSNHKLSRVTLQFHEQVEHSRIGDGDTAELTTKAKAKSIHDELFKNLNAKDGKGKPLPRLGNKAIG